MQFRQSRTTHLVSFQVLKPNISPLSIVIFTTRSSYFQQIEDVQRYTKQIIELRSAITNFRTNDMTELIKFHKDVESVLENLTDESQMSLETPF